MTIEEVTSETWRPLLAVYRESWRESHRHLCTPDYLERRDYNGFLRNEVEAGKKLYFLQDEGSVGMIALRGNEISDLYILPEWQNQGYGTALLRYVMAKCKTPRLTVLSCNEGAIRLYQRLGFGFTGRRWACGKYFELEMEFPS